MNAIGIAYVLGAIHDGCLVHRRNAKRYDIEFYQKNKEWLENSVLKRLARNFGTTTSVKGPRNGCYYLRFGNKHLYHLLEEQQRDGLPEVVENGDTKTKLAFIAGFFDAEGYCPHVEKYLAGERRRKKIPPQISMSQNMNSTKCKLLEDIRDVLEQSGVKCSKVTGPTKRSVSKKPEFRFCIYGRKNISKFFELVQPEHPEKRKRLLMLSSCSLNPKL